MITDLFEKFVREKTFLANVTPSTVLFYRDSFKAYCRNVGEQMPDRFILNEFVIKLREQGRATAGINAYIRGMNSFLTWLWENNHISERLRIKQLQEDKVVITPFTDAQVRAIISYKPRSGSWVRLHTLLCLLIDTGLRIDEALTLTRDNVDMDNLVLKVMGKGRKERVVPFSLELRKRLFKLLRTHRFDLVFCNKYGAKLTPRNLLRDFKIIGKDLGIEGVRVSFQVVHHCFCKFVMSVAR